MEAMSNDPGYGHNHVSMGIIVFLVGWEFSLFCKTSGKSLEDHFGFLFKDYAEETKNGVKCLHWTIQERGLFIILLLLL